MMTIFSGVTPAPSVTMPLSLYDTEFLAVIIPMAAYTQASLLRSQSVGVPASFSSANHRVLSLNAPVVFPVRQKQKRSKDRQTDRQTDRLG